MINETSNANDTETLREFYDFCMGVCTYPSLMYTNAVFGARADCEKKLTEGYTVCKPVEENEHKILLALYVGVTRLLGMEKTFFFYSEEIHLLVTECTTALLGQSNKNESYPVYDWNPQPNITASELALCIPILTGYSAHNVDQAFYIETLLPLSAKRHFRKTK